LLSAQSITKSSPVPTISGLVGWYETTSSNTFSTGTTTYNDVDTPDNNQQINRWKDFNPLLTERSKNNLVQQISLYQPSYIEGAINGLPAVNFSNHVLISSLNNGDLAGLSIFAVFYTNLDLANHQDIVITDGNWGGNSFTYSIHNANYFYYRTAGIYGLNSSQAISLKTPTIVQLLDNSKGDMRLYVTGQPLTTVNVIIPLKTLGFFDVGGWFFNGAPGGESLNGAIGELIIFSRAVNEEERKAIESYLSKKWAIKV